MKYINDYNNDIDDAIFPNGEIIPEEHKKPYQVTDPDTGEITATGWYVMGFSVLLGENCNDVRIKIEDIKRPDKVKIYENELMLFSAYDACKILNLLDDRGGIFTALSNIPEDSYHVMTSTNRGGEVYDVYFVDENGLFFLCMQSDNEAGEVAREAYRKSLC